MRKLILFASALSTLCLSNVSIAGIITKCPDIKAIQAIGLNHFEFKGDDWEASYRPSNKYDTKDEWLVMVGNTSSADRAKDENEIKEKATAALSKVVLIEKFLVDDHGLCVYSSTGEKTGILAVAVSPPETPPESLNQ